MLIRSARAQPFQADAYDLIFERLREHGLKLLAADDLLPGGPTVPFFVHDIVNGPEPPLMLADKLT